MKAKNKLREKLNKADDAHLSFTEKMTVHQYDQALNFYNYRSQKDHKKAILKFLANNKYNKKDIADFAKLKDAWVSSVMGCIAAIVNKNGRDILPTPEKSIGWFDNKFQELLLLARSNNPLYVSVQTTSNKPTVDVRALTIEKARSQISEIDANFDMFINDHNHKFDVYKYLLGITASSVCARMAKDIYKKIENEYLEFQKVNTLSERNDDQEQLVEAYSYLTTKTLKATLKFVHDVISECDRYLDRLKASKSPRKKKVKSADQLVKNLKYLKTFGDLKLTSVSPESIIGSSQLWAYNVKNRMLYMYDTEINDELSVKGTTVIHFSELNSLCKKLRKPEVQIPELLRCTKAKMKKFFKDLSTKESKVNGRINTDTILLKVIK
jgi:hypothetical protein